MTAPTVYVVLTADGRYVACDEDEERARRNTAHLESVHTYVPKGSERRAALDEMAEALEPLVPACSTLLRVLANHDLPPPEPAPPHPDGLTRSRAAILMKAARDEALEEAARLLVARSDQHRIDGFEELADENLRCAVRVREPRRQGALVTCIVGIQQDGVVHIGGDSHAGDHTSGIELRADEKVFARDGLIIGFTWSYRMGQLLRYALTIPKHPKKMDDHEFLVVHFVDAIRKCFAAKGWLRMDNNVESHGQFLLAYRSVLYTVESDFSISKPLPTNERLKAYDVDRWVSYASVGCGASVAIGAMHATQGLKPKTRIRRALRAASQFSMGVRPPFVILSTEAP